MRSVTRSYDFQYKNHGGHLENPSVTTSLSVVESSINKWLFYKHS